MHVNIATLRVVRLTLGPATSWGLFVVVRGLVPLAGVDGMCSVDGSAWARFLFSFLP